MRSSTLSFFSAGAMPRRDVSVRGLPRLPIFGWAAFAGPSSAGLPCILDRPDIVYTSSGRAAIALALRDLGIGPGDRVLVPTYHCPTMIAPVVAAGAHPLFFPLDAAGAPRLSALAQWDLVRVRAMIAAHYFGLPQPMSQVRQFCDDRGIALIEDCAHAMFGEADERPIGSHGHYAIASLTKFLPTTDGGCLVGARPEHTHELARRTLADQIRTVANTVETGADHSRLPGLNGLLKAGFAAVNALRRSARPSASGNGDEPARLSAQGTAEFAPGSKLWGRSTAWSRWIARTVHRGRIVSARRRNYRHLAALLADLPGARVLRPDLPEHAAPYVFPLWVEAPAKVYQRVRRAGIPVYRWDDVWPDIPMMPGDSGSEWAVHVFQLGCHQDLELDDLAAMADKLREILSTVET
jgi:dTDP-4-amino-4,6-dideoxygalactose transaminase